MDHVVGDMNLSVSSLFEYTPLQQRGRVLVYAFDVTFDGPGKSAYTRGADLLKMLDQFPSFGANDGKKLRRRREGEDCDRLRGIT